MIFSYFSGRNKAPTAAIGPPPPRGGHGVPAACTRALGVAILALLAATVHQPEAAANNLPAWRVLEFEEKAFWATARSRLELPRPPESAQYWEMLANSSVPGNSEQVSMRFDPADGQLVERARLSRGREDQRVKSYFYKDDHILRERRTPEGNAELPPEQWPLTSRQRIPYPESAETLAVTSPYLLFLLAGKLQAEGPGSSMEVLVHTDHNFYRARLTCGDGIPVPVDYVLGDGDQTRGTRETLAVAMRVEPEGDLVDDDDFALLGLGGNIIVLFDRYSGLPLQVRGQAPRVGDTEINLKSATMRPPVP